MENVSVEQLLERLTSTRKKLKDSASCLEDYDSKAVANYISLFELDEIINLTFLKKTGKETIQKQVRLEALGCLINCIYSQAIAFESFMQKDGLGLAHKWFRGSNSAVELHRLTRLLSVCVHKLCENPSAYTKEISMLKRENAVIQDIISTLAFCVRSTTNRWMSKDVVELIVELLRLMINIAAVFPEEEMEKEYMTQLGFLFVEILLLPNDIPLVQQTKLEVFKLLNFIPKPYIQFLVINEAMTPLIECLERELLDTDNTLRSNRNLAPLLIILSSICEANPKALEQAQKSIILNSNQTEEESTKEKEAVNLEPKFNPRGTIKWHLIKLMKSHDDALQGAASQLLWTLCCQEPSIFVDAAGLGNAAGFLHMKGLLKV